MGEIPAINLEFGWSLVRDKPNSEILLELLVAGSDAFEDARHHSED